MNSQVKENVVMFISIHSSVHQHSRKIWLLFILHEGRGLKAKVPGVHERDPLFTFCSTPTQGWNWQDTWPESTLHLQFELGLSVLPTIVFP